MSKKILVTGADGFIGSHLVESLIEQGNHVVALAQYNSFGSWGWLEEIEENKNLEIVAGDIRDPFFCRTIVKKVDIVYHLAALIGIPYSYTAPETYVATNISALTVPAKRSLLLTFVGHQRARHQSRGTLHFEAISRASTWNKKNDTYAVQREPYTRGGSCVGPL